MCGSRVCVCGGEGSEHPPVISQVAVGCLRNTSADPIEKQLDSRGPIVSRGRFVRSSVKYADGYKNPPDCVV